MPSRRLVLTGLTGLMAAQAWRVHANTEDTFGPTKAHAELMEIWRGQRLFVPARVAGKSTTAMLDTGAELTILDRAFAREANIGSDKSVTARGTGGSTDAGLASNVAVSAAGLDLLLPQVGIIDLTDVSTRLIGRPLTLVLGRDFFAAARFTFDFDNAQLTRVPRRDGVTGTKLTLETRNGLDTVPLIIEGQEVPADLDLGNGGDVLLSKAYAERRGFLSDGRSISKQPGGGLGGASERLLITLKTVEFAGKRFENITAAIDQRAEADDANIGIGLLSRFRLTLDIAERGLWASPR